MIVEKLGDLDHVIDSFENDVDMAEHDNDMIKFVPDDQEVEAPESDEDDEIEIVVEATEAPESNDHDEKHRVTESDNDDEEVPLIETEWINDVEIELTHPVENEGNVIDAIEVIPITEEE